MDSVQIIIGLLTFILILLFILIGLVAVTLWRPREEGLTGLMTNQIDIFGDIREKMGQLSAVADQVNQLSSMLQKTQQRGVWGEQILEVLLSSMLPKHHGPHTFSDGQKVEQVVKLPDGKIIAIDSKFVLDAFHRLENASNEQAVRQAKADLARSLRDRINETAKYIRPTEGTLDFALMFLPAEGVYYRMCSDEDFCIQDAARGGRKRVWDYALEQRVIPVSPNTLYAYLTVIVYGLQGLQIEQKAKELHNHLLQLEVEFDKIQKEWGTVGIHLNNAKGRYDDLDRKIHKFSDRLGVEAIWQLQGEESPQLNSPATDT